MKRISSAAIAAIFTLLAALGASPVSAGFSAPDVYREAAPGVVVIFGFDARGRGRSGTGSVISSDGLVLTNDHVIKDASSGRTYKTIQVFLMPELVTGDDRTDLSKPHEARIVARDADLDLALLRLVRPPSGLRPLRFGDSEEVVVGESVAAIGHPGGGGLWTLTTGTISSRRRDGVRDVFQTDAAINPGNSGGPLLDSASLLIGINTFVRRLNDDGLPLEGLNYSLRAAIVLEWLEGRGVRLVAIKRRASESGDVEAHDEVELAEQPQQLEAPEEQEQPEQLEGAAEVSPLAESLPGEAPTEAPATPDSQEAPAPPPERPEPEPREFTGEAGEEMYGYPNRHFDPEVAVKEAYRAAQHNAREAFSSLEHEELAPR
jgi:V8-like Glu-specific endopeptidase